MFNSSTNDPQKQKVFEMINGGRINAATKLLKKICRSNKYDDEAWLLLGDLSGQQSKYLEAIKCFEKAVKARPENDLAHFMLGFALQNIGRHADAIKSYRTTIQINPSHLDARHNLGSALLMLDRYEEALDVSISALELDSLDIFALLNAGNACYGLNDLVNAENYFRRVLEPVPDNYDALMGIGGVMEKNNDPVSAIGFYRSALKLQPNLPQANNNLALALYSNEQLDEAINYYKKAITIDSGYIPSLLNLGMAYKDKGLNKDAEGVYQKILSIEPNNAPVLYNLGHLAGVFGEVDKAINYYQRIFSLKALDIDPEYFEVHKSLANIYLGMAESDKGWEHYAYRKDGILKSSNDIDVNKLNGKVILLYLEQGLGDEIFFLRFASQLQQRNIKVLYRPSEKIASILSRASCIDELICDDSLQGADLSLPVGDLPLLLGIKNESDFPSPLKLQPIPERVEKIKSMLAEAGPPPYIGVTWRAGTKNDSKFLSKQIDEEVLANTVKCVKGTVLILQRLPEADEVKNFLGSLGRKAVDLSEMNDDLEDMLALLSVIDMYTGVSNTNMHLCAGLEKPCHVLVPNPPEWRWMIDGDTSPWYPGFHVYHQSRNGEWNEALDKLAYDLENGSLKTK